MMVPGIYTNISHNEYHSIEGYVSNSYLSRLDNCPANAKIPQEQTDAMTFGIAFHSFILDGPVVFSGAVAVLPDINRRTNEGKAQYSAFLEDNKGKAIITADDLTAITEMDRAVKAHPTASKLISEGSNEISIFWEDPFSGMMCKARPDKIRTRNVLVDLKKCRDASSYGFQKSIMSYGYHRQGAFYLDGMKKLTGEEFDIFAFIAVEDKPPYRCEVYTLSEPFIEEGRQDYRRLIMIEQNCRLKNEWPNYTNADVTEIELPKYLARRIQE